MWYLNPSPYRSVQECLSELCGPQEAHAHRGLHLRRGAVLRGLLPGSHLAPGPAGAGPDLPAGRAGHLEHCRRVRGLRKGTVHHT